MPLALMVATGCQSKLEAHKESGPAAAEEDGGDDEQDAPPDLLKTPDLKIVNNKIAHDGFTLSGLCPSGAPTIDINSAVGSGPSQLNQATCVDGQWSHSLRLAELPDGKVKVTVNVTGDKTRAASTEVVKDATPPTVQLGSPKLPVTRTADVQSITVNGSDNLSGVERIEYELTTDGVSFAKSVVSGADAKTIQLTMPKIKKTSAAAAIRVTVWDKAGNQSRTLSQNFVIAVDDGTAQILSPTPASVIPKTDVTGLTVGGLCARPTQKVKVIAVAMPSVPSKLVNCAAGGWTATMNLTTASDGLVTLRAEFQDEAGSIEDTLERQIVKDTTAPSVGWLRPIDPVVRRGESVPVELNAGGTGSALTTIEYALTLDGTTYDPFSTVSGGSPAFNITWPAGIPSTSAARIKVRATDAAGNTAELVSGPVMLLSRTDRFFGTFEASLGHADGSPDSVRLHSPATVTASGLYVYIAEFQTIRRITISDGTTLTLAGMYNLSGPADGVGHNAYMGAPRGLAVVGNYLYFTETTSNTLRRIDIDENSPAFKTVTTVAGLSGTAGSTDDALGVNARFRTPSGLATDGVYVYIADTGNHSLRRFDPATTAVTTVAGLSGTAGYINGAGIPTARFNGIQYLTFSNGPSSGAMGSIYTTESNNLRVRRFNISDGQVTLLAGAGTLASEDGTSATASIRLPKGIASDGNYAYLTETPPHTVRRVSLATGDVTTVAGTLGDSGYADGIGLSAKFNEPTGAYCTGGYLYVADQYNNMIRKVDTTTFAVSRFVGAPLGSVAELDPEMSSDTGGGALLEMSNGIASTDGDDIYTTNIYANTLRKVSLSNNTVTTIAGGLYQYAIADGNGTAAKFRSPRDIVKVGGFLYLTDYASNNIRKVDLSPPYAVTTIAGSTAGTSGSTDDTTGTVARFNGPIAITSDGSTYLYVADFGTRRIRRIALTPPHAVTTIAGSSTGYSDNAIGTSAQFSGPRGLALHGQNLYVGDQTNNAIRVIDLGNVNFPVTTVAGSLPPTAASGTTDGVGGAARFNAPIGLAVDPAGTGTLYVAEYGNHTIRAIDLATSAVTTFAGGSPIAVHYQDGTGLGARMINPINMTLAAGKLFIVSNSYAVIWSLDLATRVVKTIAGGVNLHQRALGRPIAGHRDGVAIVPTTETNASCIAHDTNKLYVISHVGTIKSYNHDMTGETFLAGMIDEPGSVDGMGAAARVSKSYGCEVSGGYLYFTQPMTHTFRRLDLSTGEVMTVAGSASAAVAGTDGTSGAARLNQPGGLAIIGDFAYITDGNGTTIRKVDITPGSLGVTTTLAGVYGTSGAVNGTGSGVRFSGLADLDVVGGYLYGVERNNALVRWIDPNSGDVSSVAGGASLYGNADGTGANARFAQPSAITSDGVNLWIYDAGNMLIRKLRPATGQVSTAFGVYKSRTSGDYGDIETTSAVWGSKFQFVPSLGILMPSWFSTVIIH